MLGHFVEIYIGMIVVLLSALIFINSKKSSGPRMVFYAAGVALGVFLLTSGTINLHESTESETRKEIISSLVETCEDIESNPDIDVTFEGLKLKDCEREQFGNLQ